ncbi:IS3 family transposase [Amycolatopsis sp. FDAARGOS 1241]|uniref:IS3 family transposase n=1 Tax=Amycolatopsis sp. FDAARGOS 1241 TaxID=2778070 RepID=UPI00194F3DC4|nr:IS3 family transposase [Amycolatopsis sp. FDAARGOS 1241]QRP43026.1 IS3 family transposase [Amycolatopsis sp. FDAARGOS 1241]
MIDAEKAHYPITWMCRLLGVPRSSFYAWRQRVDTETATQARRRELSTHVTRVFTQGRGTYGCRQVAAQLNREGHACSVGLVADVMRELGLAGCQPRAYKRTTVPGEEPVHSPDLIGRAFTAQAPGRRLVGDITYLKVIAGAVTVSAQSRWLSTSSLATRQWLARAAAAPPRASPLARL